MERDEDPTPIVPSEFPQAARLEASLEAIGGPVANPPENARRRWTERWGIELRLRDVAGHVGRGEASPLPAYARDSLERARALLGSVSYGRLGAEIDLDGPAERILRAVEAHVGRGSPAARFAVETALLDLAAQRQGATLARLLGGREPLVALPLAAVVSDSAEARRALDEGYRTLKLKLGRDLDGELALARRLRDANPEIALRFDANGTLPRERASSVLGALAELGAELIEEPVPLDQLGELDASAVPIALDESLQGDDALLRLAGLLDGGRVQGVVLKPMALGGLSRCLRLAACARRRDAFVIVSHCLDGPIAMGAAAALARAVACPPGRAQGLGRHRALGAFGGHLEGHEGGVWRAP